MNKGRRLVIGEMNKAPTNSPPKNICRLVIGVNAKNLATFRMGYTRIERLAGGAARSAKPE